MLEKQFIRSALVARICPPPISVDFPHIGKIWIFRSSGKQFQNAHSIRNFTLNNFALRDRFNIPDDWRDYMRIPNYRFLTIASRYIANASISLKPSGIWNPSREAKLFKVKFRIGYVLWILFSAWSENPYFATMGEIHWNWDSARETIVLSEHYRLWGV